MNTSLNPCLCKDLYGYLMELYLGLGFSSFLVRNSSTFNNEVVWFGCGAQWRKNLYRENNGF